MIKSSKKSLFLFSFLMTVNFCTPVFAAFFQSEHGFSKSQITSLFAIFSFAVFIFEIPTGLIGDKIGEKKSLIIGAILTGLATILFIIGNKPLIYIGEVVFGLGSTFYSGPFESLVYKYCKCSEDNLDYDRIVSKTYSLQWGALCFSFVGCFFLTKYGNIRFPFIATLVSNLLLCITAFCLPAASKGNKENTHTFSIMKGFLYDIYSNKLLRTVCGLNIFFSMILVSGYQLLQTYLLESAVPKSYNGLLYFIAAIFASFGSFFFDKLQSIIKSKKAILLFSLLVISICFLGLAIVTDVFLIFVLVSCYRLVWGVASPMFASMVNKSIIKDDYRNTTFSMVSLGNNLSSSILLFIFVMLNLHVKYYYIILGVLTVVAIIIYTCSKKLQSISKS